MHMYLTSMSLFILSHQTYSLKLPFNNKQIALSALQKSSRKPGSANRALVCYDPGNGGSPPGEDEELQGGIIV